MARPLRKSKTAVHTQKRKLTEEEERLRREQEKLESFLRQAPKLKEEQKKRRIEEIRLRAQTLTLSNGVANVLHDTRYGDRIPTRRAQRSLAKHARQARLRFFLLCAILAVFLFLLLKSLPTV